MATSLAVQRSLPRGLVRGQHPAPAQGAAARQRVARSRAGIVRPRVGRGQPRPGGRTPPTGRPRTASATPSAAGRARVGGERTRRRGRRRRAPAIATTLARCPRCARRQDPVQLRRLHTAAGHREAGLERHLDAVAIERELQELQSHRAVRQRQQAQLAACDGDPGAGRAGVQLGEQHAAAQVETAACRRALRPRVPAAVRRPAATRTRDQSATGTSAGTGGSVFGMSNRPAT